MIINYKGLRINLVGFEPDAPLRCEMCGSLTPYLLPYGPIREFICFECGKKNKHQTEKWAEERARLSDAIMDFENILPMIKVTEQQVISALETAEKEGILAFLDTNTNKLLTKDKLVDIKA